MSDKTKTISISVPESLAEEISKTCFPLDVSASKFFTTAAFMLLPLFKAHPGIVQFYEFEKVKQYYDAVSENKENDK